jgi:hypothetical protein
MTWNMMSLEGSSYSLAHMLVANHCINLEEVRKNCEIISNFLETGSRFELGTSRIQA